MLFWDLEGILRAQGVTGAFRQACFCFTAPEKRLITSFFDRRAGYVISFSGYAATRTFVFWGMAANQSTLSANGYRRTGVVIIITVALCAIALASCSGQKAIGGIYLNHPDMSPGSQVSESFEINFQTYREGAAGGRTGSAGAGCGCQ